ncbi:kinase inhibitor [Halobacteriovorax marinus]|uniref:Kinase inhibitor n=1 Tax=Halobacteriovorax marinus TaxID=97084 RepID=A0A1Y5F7L4_9BACT|nr:kinase inhibitor [Halobacteriovorax marinus]
MKVNQKVLVLLTTFLITATSFAGNFKLTSTEISQYKFMSKAQEFTGFGCSGGNTSPELSWAGAPKGTVAYAVFVYDPDAPTGSGWWHWQLVNIPKNVTSLQTGAGDLTKNLAPKDSLQIENDYGFKGFGGACPPQGHGVHHYQFTVYALSKKLDLPKNASGALTGYMVKANSLASATIVALYKRN